VDVVSDSEVDGVEEVAGTAFSSTKTNLNPQFPQNLMAPPEGLPHSGQNLGTLGAEVVERVGVEGVGVEVVEGVGAEVSPENRRAVGPELGTRGSTGPLGPTPVLLRTPDPPPNP